MSSKQKIALVGYKLGKGGAERVLSNLSNYLVQHGVEVHIIIMIDEVSYPYSGTLHNLGVLRSATNGLVNKWKRFKQFRTILREERFDWVIDFRFRVQMIQELLIYSLYPKSSIQTVHSSAYHSYLFSYPLLSKFIFNRFAHVVCVSQAMRDKVVAELGFSHVRYIPNMIPIKKVEQLSQFPIGFDERYLIFVGRMDQEKQIHQLIRTYLSSELPRHNIHFVLIGKGDFLEALQEDFSSDMIHFMGYIPNPYPWIKHAMFLTLSSKFEGFPMVIAEALACETPVVSFDCVSGPAEMIVHGVNGYLVENQNWYQLLNYFNDIALHPEQLTQLRANARESVRCYDVETVGRQWLELFKTPE